jgi:hypothetical protein
MGIWRIALVAVGVDRRPVKIKKAPWKKPTFRKRFFHEESVGSGTLTPHQGVSLTLPQLF